MRTILLQLGPTSPVQASITAFFPLFSHLLSLMLRLGREAVSVVVQNEPRGVESQDNTTSVPPSRHLCIFPHANNTLEPLQVPNVWATKLCNFRNETMRSLRDMRQHLKVEDLPCTTKHTQGLLKLSHAPRDFEIHDKLHRDTNALQRRAKVRVLTRLTFWSYSLFPRTGSSRVTLCYP